MPQSTLSTLSTLVRPKAVARPAPAHHLDNVRRKALLTVFAAGLALAGALLQAQGFRRFVWEPNVPYDGKFTFARISYTVYGGRSGWEYDYPPWNDTS